MRKLFLFANVVFCTMAAIAQPGPGFTEKEVFKNDDVVIRQIDEHTWHGNGHLMANEAIYIIEGNDRAILLDAGTKIDNLDKIVAGITSKPVTLIATHVHPDHTGESIKYFSEIYINAADMVNKEAMMKDYQGTIKYLTDGETIDLGGRKIEVIFTPGHTPGSTTFIDLEKGYGFSGDAFGSGNLLLTTNFSTLRLTCLRMKEYMEKHNITKLYPGHYFGVNCETQKRVSDMLQMATDMLDGKVKGEKNPQGMLGLDHILFDNGVRINYGEAQLK